MRRIDLDYQRTQGRHLGSALFAAGGLLAVVVSFAAWQQGQAVAALDERLVRLERPRPAQAAAGRAVDPALARGLREAQVVGSMLDRRWGQLFESLEAAQNPDIALLSVEPDADKGVVLISAEARQREAMLAYLQRLGQTPTLRDAVLVEHRVQRQVAERPIRFSLSARWERSP